MTQVVRAPAGRRLVLVSEVNDLRRIWRELNRVRRGIADGTVPVSDPHRAEAADILSVALEGVEEVARLLMKETEAC